MMSNKVEGFIILGILTFVALLMGMGIYVSNRSCEFPIESTTVELEVVHRVDYYDLEDENYYNYYFHLEGTDITFTDDNKVWFYVDEEFEVGQSVTATIMNGEVHFDE